MENKKFEELGRQHIPLQFKGSEMSAIEQAVLTTEEEAVRFFELVKERLLNINNWGKFAELPMSSFRLTNQEGEDISGLAKKGNFVKIDIPGPGSKAGNGFDWVILEAIDFDKTNSAEYMSIRVRPAANPLEDNLETAHFLKEDATSTFQVKRIGNTIYAEWHGKNEMPNTDTETMVDNVRNTMVGWAAKLGLSYPQWKSLVKGFLNTESNK